MLANNESSDKMLANNESSDKMLANNESSDKVKTYPITFRLPERLVEDLRKESQGLHVSLNTLAKQIFDRYIFWERHSSRMGLIPLTKSFIAETINSLSEQKIRHIAVNGSKDALKELILLAKGDLTLVSFISVFNEWLNASLMPYRYEYNGISHRYVIHHSLGTKWSIYLASLIVAVCKDVAKINPDIQIRSDSISVDLPAK